MDYRKESLRLHGEWKGKIEVNARAKVNDKDSLSLAYTPGVAVKWYMGLTYEDDSKNDVAYKTSVGDQVAAVALEDKYSDEYGIKSSDFIGKAELSLKMLVTFPVNQENV